MTDFGLRCADVDRDRAGAVLREALAEGRISLDELDDRLDRIYRSRTYGELDATMCDIPAWAALRHPAPPDPAVVMPPPRRSPGSATILWALMAVWVLWAVVAVSTSTAGGAPVLPVLVIVMAVVIAHRRRRRWRRRAAVGEQPPASLGGWSDPRSRWW